MTRRDDKSVALTTPVLCRLAGLSPSTLDSWVKEGLVTPSVLGSRGRRATRLWTTEDAVVVRSIKALREAGCPMSKVREVKALITRSWNERLTDYVLYWNGSDVLGLDAWGRLVSLLKRPGQQMLHLVALPLGTWLAEAERLAAPVKLPPGTDKPTSVRTPTRSIARSNR